MFIDIDTQHISAAVLIFNIPYWPEYKTIQHAFTLCIVGKVSFTVHPRRRVLIREAFSLVKVKYFKNINSTCIYLVYPSHTLSCQALGNGQKDFSPAVGISIFLSV